MPDTQPEQPPPAAAPRPGESAASPEGASGEAPLGQAADRQGLLRAAGIVGLGTVLSRILGLLRDRYMAALFGATFVNDAFQLAFLLPNMTRRMFGEGALASSFVPVFSERLATGRRESAFQAAAVLLTRLAAGLLLFCVVMVGLSLVARHLFALPQSVTLTLKLSEIMVGYCLLINVAGVLMGILNSLKHFWSPALSPMLLNLGMIAACWYGGQFLPGAREEQVTLVALAVMGGGLLQLLIMVPPALGLGFRFRPSLDRKDEGYREVMRNFGPVIFGVALFQVNLLVDQFVARVLIPEHGPVTMLAYGNRLIQFPWAIFSISLATAALPMLSRYWAQDDKKAFGAAVSTAVRSTLFLAAPSTVGLCLLSTDLVRLVYGAGAFMANDGEAVVRTGRVVWYFAMGLCFYSLNSILARALYATKDTRTPTQAAVWAVGANLVLNLVLVLGTDLKEAGLALSSALSGVLQTFLMARVLIRKMGPLDHPHLKGFLAWVGGSALLGALGVVSGLYDALGTAFFKALFRTSDDPEGFMTFAFTAAAVLAPIILAGRHYFFSQLPGPAPSGPAPSGAIQPFPPKSWSAELVLFYAFFTTLLSCIVMGLVVWAVRQSLPPGEQSFALVFQRGLVSTACGVAAFLVAAGSFQSLEYEELKAAFLRRVALR